MNNTIELAGKTYILVQSTKSKLHKIACDECAFYKDYIKCGNDITLACMDDLNKHWEETK